MARKKNSTKVTTADGGTMTFVANERGIGGKIVIERGFKETPEARRERMAAGNRSRTFTPGKNKNKGGRQGAKRAAISSW